MRLTTIGAELTKKWMTLKYWLSTLDRTDMIPRDRAAIHVEMDNVLLSPVRHVLNDAP